MTETQQTINNVIAKMIAYSDGNKHDIAHFLKVYTYARMIGEMENLTERKQEILEIAAVWEGARWDRGMESLRAGSAWGRIIV